MIIILINYQVVICPYPYSILWYTELHPEINDKKIICFAI